jgi:DNA-binding response OmpR family regulator
MFSPTILLLEDEALIALDVEQTLTGATTGKIEHFTSCANAMAWLVNHTPDLAVLDIFLRDGECIDVARVLSERRVPFVVHSARRKVTQESHRLFLNGEWVCKPADPMSLAAAVDVCLRARRDAQHAGREKTAIRAA